MSVGRDGRDGLIASIRVPFRYEHYLRLKAIDSHDFSPVVRKVAQDRGELDDDLAERAIVYLKRYYALLLLDPLNPPAMSRPLDDFWHVHALHSHQYFAFCDQVYGEYIHHVPLLFDDDIAMRFVQDLYTATLEKHRKVFGDFDTNIIPQQLDAALCCTPHGPTNRALKELALFPAGPPILHGP